MNNINDGRIVLEGLGVCHVSQKDYEAYTLEQGDFLVNRTNSETLVGKAAVVDDISKGGMFASYLVRLKFDLDKGHPAFVNAWWQTSYARGRLKAIATPGVSQYNLNPTELQKQFFLPLPPIQEQRQIIATLNKWDDAIVNTEILIAAKREFRKGLMQQLLTGKRRFPGFTSAWSEVSLFELLEPISRRIEKPSSPYWAVGIRSHGKGTFARWVDDPDIVQMEHLFVCREGDLVLNITFAWEGAIAFVPSEHDGHLASHRFPTYRLKAERVTSEFLRYLVIQSRFIYLLGCISPGGAGRNRVLSKRDFLQLKIRVPALDEQEAIGQTLGALSDEISKLQALHGVLKLQKKGLMQQLLTGKVRVKIPASAA